MYTRAVLPPFLRPSRLPQLAATISLTAVAILWAVGCCSILTLFFGLHIAAGNEPLPDLNSYLAVVPSGLAVGLVLALPMTAAGLALLLSLSHPARPERARARVKLAALTSLTLAPFLLLWSIATIFRAMRHGFGLIKPPPTWMTAPVWEILGSCFWLPAALIAMLVLYTRGARTLDHLFTHQCRACGYAITDLAGVCPECGHHITRD
jgi:hypothetical protein